MKSVIDPGHMQRFLIPIIIRHYFPDDDGYEEARQECPFSLPVPRPPVLCRTRKNIVKL